MREQAFMKKWVEDHLCQHSKDYWLRLPDTASGIKPFDGVLLCRGKAVAIEFKVWRKKKDYDYSDLRPHQLRELLRWEESGGVSRIVVFFTRSKKVRVLHPKRKVLRQLLGK